jgi:hypothetical protein
MESVSKGLNIRVVEHDGKQAIAMFLYDIEQMILLSPESAKMIAFHLVNCADFVEPPFQNSGSPTGFFAAYNASRMRPNRRNDRTS